LAFEKSCTSSYQKFFVGGSGLLTKLGVTVEKSGQLNTNLK